MDWKTIRIPASDFERHNQRRKSTGMTWAEYIDDQAPNTDTSRQLELLVGRIDELSMRINEMRNRLDALI